MKFLDEAKIFIQAGDGGNGCVSFHRAKFVEKGGPDGGKGGRGGDIILRTQKDLNTLIDYRYHQHFKAPKGGHGSGKSRAGADGAPLYLNVPPGTQVWDSEKKVLLAEMFGGEKILLKGAIGGLGNESFKSSVRQAPRIAQKGQKADSLWIWLKLKLIADVGLIGLPNAGKSTLLGAMTNATPKTGDYPFTTTYPHLGTFSNDHHTYVMADIPGIIQGAHQGKGKGLRFLGHIERCALLLHVLDISSAHLEEDFYTVFEELRKYGKDILNKKTWVLLTKEDAVSKKEKEEALSVLDRIFKGPVFVCSGLQKKSLTTLIKALEKELSP